MFTRIKGIMMSTQRRNRHHHDQHQQSRVFYELSALVMNLMRSPPSTMTFTDHSPSPTTRMPSSNSLPPMTPSGFAWLMLGVSLALMLCGSVTFFIGFMLMPWVICLVMVFYVVGIVSAVSMLGRSIFCSVLGPGPSPSPSPRKEIPAWKCM